nr:glycosyltransferase [Motilibacter aurantiacus]
MLAANDVATDTRIRKAALSLARLGLDVTLLAYAPEGERSESWIGPVRVLRVPVVWGLRDTVRERRERRRATPRVLGYASRFEEREARVRARLGFEEATLRGGAAAQVSRNVWRARGQLVKVRRRGQTAFGFTYRRAWRVFDKAAHSVPVVAPWRRVLPQVLDYALAYGPVLDELAPDVIHAHDVEMTVVAAQAAARARAAGRDVQWVYDAHEYVRGLSIYGGRTPRVRAAWAALEAEYVRSAARVVTVSPDIADRLQAQYSLAERPAVVLNTPVSDAISQGASGPPPEQDVRDSCGLGPDVPLLLYSGGVTAARGVGTAVEALTRMPDAHLAVVAVPSTRTIAVGNLREEAERAGVLDRVHLLEPVAPADVVPYLSGADVGLIPLMHFGSHDMALTNKLFEYIHAGVPVVVSDCAAQAAFVRRHGIGEVHAAGDAAGLAAAATAVLAGRKRYLAPLHEESLLGTYSWRGQEEELRAVYEKLLGRALTLPPEDLRMSDLVEQPGSGGPEHVEEPVGGPDEPWAGAAVPARPADALGRLSGEGAGEAADELTPAPGRAADDEPMP